MFGYPGLLLCIKDVLHRLLLILDLGAVLEPQSDSLLPAFVTPEHFPQPMVHCSRLSHAASSGPPRYFGKVSLLLTRMLVFGGSFKMR